MGYKQPVTGPAGSGKSPNYSGSYDNCQTVGRTIHLVNLETVVEHFDHPVDMDIREPISMDDVMEEKEIGLPPNGYLIYCMENLKDSLDDWFDE